MSIYIYMHLPVFKSPPKLITLQQSTVAKRMKIPNESSQRNGWRPGGFFVAIATELVTPLHDVIIQVLSGWWFGTFG